jgi:hypothetical protein
MKKKFHKEKQYIKSGLIIKFERIIGERKKLKGIVDRIIIDDSIEISKDQYGNLVLRTFAMPARLFVYHEASNVINIVHPRTAEKIENVLRQEHKS